MSTDTYDDRTANPVPCVCGRRIAHGKPAPSPTACGAPDRNQCRMGPVTHGRCAQCGLQYSLHCQFDEPGVDHSSGCRLMHHTFKVEL